MYKFNLLSLIITALTLNACTSMPVRDVPNIDKSLNDISFGTLAIIGCEVAEQETSRFLLGCADKSQHLAYALERTKLFSDIFVGKSNSADYLITLKPYDRKPYYASIGHNPGILVLSTAIPFWETYSYGYDFTIKHAKTGKEKRVNTLEEGTHLMWSVSMLINILPSRGLPGTHSSNESLHLKNSIINAISNSALNKSFNLTFIKEKAQVLFFV